MENISREEAIKIICEDYENKIYNEKPFIIQDYDFKGLKINIEIKKHPNWDRLVIDFNIQNYVKSDYELETLCLSNKEDYEDSFDTIEELVSFLFEDFRTEYLYSKILDQIDSEDKIKQKEKLFRAYSILCKNNSIEDCCVCFEENKVLTDCNHSVCRTCYNNIKYTKIGNGFYEHLGKSCPLCRQLI